jgi:hypothetical protein
MIIQERPLALTEWAGIEDPIGLDADQVPREREGINGFLLQCGTSERMASYRWSAISPRRSGALRATLSSPRRYKESAFR